MFTRFHDIYLYKMIGYFFFVIDQSILQKPTGLEFPVFCQFLFVVNKEDELVL